MQACASSHPGTFGGCSGLAVGNVEVIAADAGGEKVFNLPVNVLSFGGYADAADQFGHWPFAGVSQLMV